MNLWLIACCMTVSLAACAWTMSAEMDPRLMQIHDKDHPHDFKPNFPNRAAWEKRAQTLRQQALVALGLWPMPEKSLLKPAVHGRVDRDTYTIEKVYFASMPGHYVTGNLYRPKGKSGKLPAVLCPYGHWPSGRFVWKNDEGVKKEIDSGAETDPIAAKTPLQANCAMLARMGCIVFQYDMVGYCDSTKIPHREGFLDAESILRLQSFMGLQTWNSVRAMDFVLSLPEVDPNRVAVTGSSSGGTQTIALNAVDPRAAVAVPMVMVSMNMQGGCVCENAPLYRVLTNNVELACLFAPKPEGMAAANDWTRDFMTRGLPEMKAIWKLFGAEERVDGAHVNFPHNHNLHSRELQYNFLNKHLKLGWPVPVKEQKFEPFDPKELSVWDDQHPMPSDALDASALRKQMTRASDEQLAKLSDQEYLKTLRAALAAMVVHSTTDDVPVRKMMPDKWNGQIVVWAEPNGADALLNRGFAVFAVDPFKPAPKPPEPPSTRPNSNPSYAAYSLGYERSVIANRVHDLLGAVAMAQATSGTKSVHLIGIAEQALPALLAKALAGAAVDRAAIDLRGFDFDLVQDDKNPMLLPGALKYGGIMGFAPLCDSGSTLIINARNKPTRAAPKVTISSEPASLIDWISK